MNHHSQAWNLSWIEIYREIGDKNFDEAKRLLSEHCNRFKDHKRSEAEFKASLDLSYDELNKKFVTLEMRIWI